MSKAADFLAMYRKAADFFAMYRWYRRWNPRLVAFKAAWRFLTRR